MKDGIIFITKRGRKNVWYKRRTSDSGVEKALKEKNSQHEVLRSHERPTFLEMNSVVLCDRAGSQGHRRATRHISNTVAQASMHPRNL